MENPLPRYGYYGGVNYPTYGNMAGYPGTGYAGMQYGVGYPTTGLDLNQDGVPDYTGAFGYGAPYGYGYG